VQRHPKLSDAPPGKMHVPGSMDRRHERRQPAGRRTGNAVNAYARVLAAIALAPFLPTASTARQLPPWTGVEPVPRAFDISLTYGTAFSSDWSDLVLLGSVSAGTAGFEQIVLRDVSVEPGWGFGVSLTYWEGRGAVRLAGSYASSCLAVGAACVGAPGEGVFPSPTRRSDVQTWTLDLGGILNLREGGRPRDRFKPYLYFGLGGVAYDPDPQLARLITGFLDFERTVDAGDGRFIVIVDGATQFLLAVDEVGFTTKFGGALALGADLQLPLDPSNTLGLRFEVSDHITGSPLGVRLVQLGSDFPYRWDEALEEASLDFGPVHNLRLSVGLTVGIGLRDGIPTDRWWW
jgi:hypothetical protein